MTRIVAVLVMVAGWFVSQAPGGLSIEAASRAVQPGEIVLLSVHGAAAGDRVNATAFDRPCPVWAVDDRTWQVLVGIDLDVKPGSHVVTIRAGSTTTPYALTVLAKRFPTRKLTVDEAFVNPPASAQPRIAAEAARLNALWAAPAPARLWSGPFGAPVPQPPNSAFGTRSVYNGQPRSAHGGADFPSPSGTPIHAPNAGKVVLADNLYYTGNTIVIDHGLGLFSLFAHLSRIDVHDGAAIEKGAVVGLVGATGRVTGPHLHWTVRAGGARVDPMAVMAILK
jgi:murein DD-endopeptidase MepM/ murein hydrolase activator NlpD